MKSLLLLLCILVSTITALGQGAGASTTSSAVAQISSALAATPVPITATTVTATTSVVGVANGIYNASDFGIKCDGSTDDTSALNSIGTFAATQTTTGNTIAVSFPSNAICVYASSITTWLVPSLHIQGNGSRLKFTGSGHAIYLHSGSTELGGNQIGGFILQGNASADYGVYNDSLTTRGKLEFDNIQDFTVACAYLGQVELYDQVDISCSGQKATLMGVPQTTTPTNGVILGDTGWFFANNRRVIIQAEEYGTGIGVWCKNCTNGNVISGTAESSSGTGLQIEFASTGNIFAGFDAEANTVQDLLDKGHGNSFISATFPGTVNFAGAVAENFTGGQSGNVVDVGGTCAGMTMTGTYIGTATLNGNGIGWTFSKTFNVSTGAPNTGAAWEQTFDYLKGNSIVLSGAATTGYDQTATVAATAGLTAASGTAVCNPYWTCTSRRGLVNIVGGTLTTGAAFTITWAATPGAMECIYGEESSTAYHGFSDYTAPTTTYATVGPSVSFSGATASIAYSCGPPLGN